MYTCIYISSLFITQEFNLEAINVMIEFKMEKWRIKFYTFFLGGGGWGSEQGLLHKTVCKLF